MGIRAGILLFTDCQHEYRLTIELTWDVMRASCPAGRAAEGTEMLMMWTTTGPGEAVTAVAVSPVDDQAVLAAGETGVWQTLDGGGTWTQVSTTQLGRGLSIAPDPADTVYGISSD